MNPKEANELVESCINAAVTKYGQASGYAMSLGNLAGIVKSLLTGNCSPKQAEDMMRGLLEMHKTNIR